MKKYVTLKLIGLSLLTMIILVIISFAEVAVYSYAVNPGQDESVYEAHANASAPYVSGIAGFITFFLIARYWKKRGFENAFQLALLFPLTYVLLDIVVISLAGLGLWATFIWIFLAANSAKFLGSYLGYKFPK